MEDWGCETGTVDELDGRKVSTKTSREARNARRRYGFRRGDSGDIRAQAQLLQRGRVQLAAGIDAVSRLEFLHGGDGIGVPLTVGVAIVIAASREGGLDSEIGSGVGAFEKAPASSAFSYSFSWRRSWTTMSAARTCRVKRAPARPPRRPLPTSQVRRFGIGSLSLYAQVMPGSRIRLPTTPQR